MASRRAQGAGFFGRSERSVDCSQLVLMRAPLAELLPRSFIFDVERPVRVMSEPLSCDAARRLSLRQPFTCGVAPCVAGYGPADCAHRLLRQPGLEVEAGQPIAPRPAAVLAAVGGIEREQVHELVSLQERDPPEDRFHDPDTEP